MEKAAAKARVQEDLAALKSFIAEREISADSLVVYSEILQREAELARLLWLKNRDKD